MRPVIPRVRTVTMFTAILAMVALTVPPVAMGARPPTELPFTATMYGADADFNVDPVAIAARCGDVPRTFAVATFVGEGRGTHIGRFESVAVHCSYLDEFGNQGSYAKGEVTMVGANGDVLEGTYTNGVSLTPPPVIEFKDHLTLTGGTGRFANASGSVAETGLFWFATGESIIWMEGTIVYDASDRANK